MGEPFWARVRAAQARNESWLCIGLDPDRRRIGEADVAAFLIGIVEATADLACAYKLNLAFYEALGLEGLRAMGRVRERIPASLPAIADAKRADIGHSAAAYARGLFEASGFDASTVNPYLGEDGLAPFLAYADRGVIVLCRTSNPGAGDFQSLLCLQSDGTAVPLYEVVAARARDWNRQGNVGLVAGATYPEELRRLRAIAPDLPFLVPGIGTQGGDLAAAVEAGSAADGTGPLINVGREILYAEPGPRFAEAARRAAERFRKAIDERRGRV